MRCKVIVFGANNFPEQLPYNGKWICWDKRVNSNADRMLGSPFELAWDNRTSGFDRIYRVMHGGVVNSDGGKRFHPTQKPILLFEKILEDYTNLHDLILDPFCGSGTTCIAAKKLGRRYIGIEISEEYCQIARERLRAIDTGVPVKEARKGQKALFGESSDL
jgi:DNA modification methylase